MGVTAVTAPGGRADLFQRHRPGEEKRDFEVEQDEQDRHEVVANVELHARIVEGIEAALVGGQLFRVRALVGDDEGHDEQRKPDPEKLSAYECGFNAFDDARMKFDVRFYLVAILFIIFDLEVSFLFPWAVAFGRLGLFGFWSMMIFLGVLTVGFVYEWKKGALEWD